MLKLVLFLVGVSLILAEEDTGAKKEINGKVCGFCCNFL